MSTQKKKPQWAYTLESMHRFAAKLFLQLSIFMDTLRYIWLRNSDVLKEDHQMSFMFYRISQHASFICSLLIHQIHMVNQLT